MLISETIALHAPQRGGAPLSQGVVSGIVAFCDVVAVLAALPAFGSYTVDSGVQGGAFTASVGWVGLAALLVLLSFNAGGLYRFSAVMRPGKHVRRVVLLGSLVALVLAGLAFSLRLSTDFSTVRSFVWLSVSATLLLVLRFAVAAALGRLARSGRIGRKIIVYGAGAQGERLIRRIIALDEPWNRIVGVFDDRTARSGPTVAGYPVMGDLSALLRFGQSDRPDEVLLALPWGAEDRIIQILHRLAVLPANVRLVPEFQRLDLVQGRTNSQFGLPMLNAYEKPVEGWGKIWKRLFDVALAAVAMAPAAPLMLIIAAFIRLESSGPILFRQPRYGFNNKLVHVYKFRTMYAEASDSLGQCLTKRGDLRVTRVGAVLRRFSLDELPQLINVFRSEMSLVGPRPHAIRTTAGGRQCDEVVDQYAVRHKVKPGITGWAQVNGWRGTMETEEHLVKRLEHDLYYINNWSPLLDIKILLLTIWTVLNGRNSY